MLSADDEALIERILVGRLVQTLRQPINKSQAVRLALRALARMSADELSRFAQEPQVMDLVREFRRWARWRELPSR